MKPLPQATLKPQAKVIEKERSHSGNMLNNLPDIPFNSFKEYGLIVNISE